MSRSYPPRPPRPVDPTDHVPLATAVAASDLGTTRDTIHSVVRGTFDLDDAPVHHVTHDPDTGLPWPEPSVPEPEFLALAQFLFDAVAEATDGCLVEPDGVCTHGHPSWLRRFGVL
ncbi:hypothetical protein [Methylobacterium sp. sgz302541]|uniref:hypothetical protein n=1 Tax=unclassified Methylobacterium TaxID=2615210 RepID=UPI003D342706